MVKYVLILLTFLMLSCSSGKQMVSIYDKNVSLKDEINKSVIDGFYDGNISEISNNIYLLK